MIWLAALSFICAAGPALLFLRNLRALQAPPAGVSASATVLIPARDEELNIARAVEAALRSGATEVIVLDDGSTDGTAGIVREMAAQTPALRLVTGRLLPQGWVGKSFACAQLAEASAQPLLVFVDADVRLAEGSVARMAAFLQSSGAELASGVPQQITVTFSEQLLLPLIYFVLLGFLPLERMRASRHPAYGTGCGQLFIADAEAYRRSGGHAAIRGRVHDGLALPKSFRAAGFRTDLFDATDVATCRMYRRDGEVWRGLAKNAIDGLGAPRLILPATLLLLLGQVAPFAVLALAQSRVAFSLGLGAAVAALLPGAVAMARFRQPLLSVVLHPAAVLALLAIQWFALLRRLAGRRAKWKGRSLGPVRQDGSAG